jgi:putative endonuclease
LAWSQFGRFSEDGSLNMGHYFVYIITNKSRTIYTGMTNDLERRMSEHKRKLIKGFSATYNITKLVYYEAFNEAGDAIAREKQIKGWLRAKKIALIESLNPQWNDLSENWFEG